MFKLALDHNDNSCEVALVVLHMYSVNMYHLFMFNVYYTFFSYMTRLYNRPGRMPCQQFQKVDFTCRIQQITCSYNLTNDM